LNFITVFHLCDLLINSLNFSLSPVCARFSHHTELFLPPQHSCSQKNSPPLPTFQRFCLQSVIFSHHNIAVSVIIWPSDACGQTSLISHSERRSWCWPGLLPLSSILQKMSAPLSLPTTHYAHSLLYLHFQCCLHCAAGAGAAAAAHAPWTPMRTRARLAAVAGGARLPVLAALRIRVQA